MTKILEHGTPKELVTQTFICSECACVFTTTENNFNHYLDRRFDEAYNYA